jgi:hypothetical protein
MANLFVERRADLVDGHPRLKNPGGDLGVGGDGGDGCWGDEVACNLNKTGHFDQLARCCCLYEISEDDISRLHSYWSLARTAEAPLEHNFRYPRIRELTLDNDAIALGAALSHSLLFSFPSLYSFHL